MKLPKCGRFKVNFRIAGFYGNLPKTQIDPNRSMSSKAPCTQQLTSIKDRSSLEIERSALLSSCSELDLTRQPDRGIDLIF